MEPNVKNIKDVKPETPSLDDLLDTFREIMDTPSEEKIYVEDEWDNIHGDMIHF